MASNLLSQAKQLAQAGIAVFPVGSDKAPRTPNGYHDATTDIAQIEAWDWPGIGVPMAPNGLVAFDLDYGHTDDDEVLGKLEEWEDKHWSDHYHMRETQSGGIHIICKAIEGKKPPAYIMPYLDVRYNGYVVWALADGGYGWADGIKEPWKLSPATPEMYAVVEKQKGVSSDGGLTSLEQAWENIDAGVHVHDSILAISQWYVNNHPGEAPEKICDWVEAEVRSMIPDSYEHTDVRLEWEDERGELWRAVNGAYDFIAGDLKWDHGVDLMIKHRPRSSTDYHDAAVEVAVDEAVEDYETINLNDLEDEVLPDIDWIVDDVIPAGNLISITGPSSAGKTRFNALLMVALSSGRTDLIGLPKAVRPIRCMYIANEERTIDVKRRLKAAKKLNNLPGNMDVIIRGKEKGRFSLVKGGVRNDVGVEALIDAANRGLAELICLDPVVTLGIEDENKSPEVDAVMAVLQEITVRTGACVMFVHHTPKGERGAPEDQWRGDPTSWRGAGAFYSSLDLGFTLSKWLPSECHVSGAEGKKAQRKWRKLRREKDAPNYVVLDGAKERENEGLGSVMFEIVGVELNEGGHKIGAMRPVDADNARLNASMILSRSDELEDGASAEWARVLITKFGYGKYKTSLKEIAELLDAAGPVGWDKDRDRDVKLRANQGAGKQIMDRLEGIMEVDGKGVELKNVKGTIWCQVSKVS